MRCTSWRICSSSFSKRHSFLFCFNCAKHFLSSLLLLILSAVSYDYFSFMDPMEVICEIKTSNFLFSIILVITLAMFQASLQLTCLHSDQGFHPQYFIILSLSNYIALLVNYFSLKAHSSSSLFCLTNFLYCSCLTRFCSSSIYFYS